MFNSRDFLGVEHNVLSKNVTRDVSQSEKTYIIWSHIIKYNIVIIFVGSLFTTYKLSEVNGSIQADWSIDSNYDDVVDTLTLSYAIMGYGDCKIEPNPSFINM